MEPATNVESGTTTGGGSVFITDSLSGEVHQQEVEDWSFTSDALEIFIETVTSYWIPHSVTAW